MIKTQGTTSRSLHSLGELKNTSEPLDYCFFGPVYESISKKGYVPKVSMPELGATLHTLKKAKTEKPLVYALGGVKSAEKSLNFLTLALTELLCLVQFGGKRDPVSAFEKYKYVERSTWAKKEKDKGLLQRLLAKEDS